MDSQNQSFVLANLIKPLLVIIKAIVVIVAHIFDYINLATLAAFAEQVSNKFQEWIRSAILLMTSATY